MTQTDLLRFQRAVDDFSKLHDVLTKLIQFGLGNDRLKLEAWERHGTSLATKVVQHLDSAKRIADGIRDPIVEGQVYVDFSSVSVLVRSALEAFIVYAYIYDCPDRSLAKFRHNTWEYGGLFFRQKLIARTEENRNKQRAEKPQMDALESSIRSSPHFSSLQKRNKIFTMGDWKAGANWQALGTSAGLHPDWIGPVYNHLSSHAHASYGSILQLDQAVPTDQAMMANTMLTIGLEIMAHLSLLYANRQSLARKFLDENSEALELVEFWRFTTKDYDRIFERSEAELMSGSLSRPFLTSPDGQTLIWTQSYQLHPFEFELSQWEFPPSANGAGGKAPDVDSLDRLVN